MTCADTATHRPLDAPIRPCSGPMQLDCPPSYRWSCVDDREVPIKRIKMSPVSRCEIFTGAAVCFMETRPV